MRLRDVLLFQPDFLQEATPLGQPWHQPPFLAPSATDVMDTQRDLRSPGEVATYLKAASDQSPNIAKGLKN